MALRGPGQQGTHRGGYGALRQFHDYQAGQAGRLCAVAAGPFRVARFLPRSAAVRSDNVARMRLGMLVHASCAARGVDAVLFLGPPGSGKSDLVLRLLGCGWGLVADDQVSLAPSCSPAAPPALAGRLELRGVGIFTGLACAAPPLTLRLAVELLPPGIAPPRLPGPRCWSGAGMSLPSLQLAAFEASAPAKIGWALDAVLGLRVQAAGAFAG